MDVADDADGRVAVFTVDAGSPEPPAGTAATRRGPVGVAADHVGVWLDGAYTGVGLAVALVAILVLGLLLSRH